MMQQAGQASALAWLIAAVATGCGGKSSGDDSGQQTSGSSSTTMMTTAQTSTDTEPGGTGSTSMGGSTAAGSTGGAMDSSSGAMTSGSEDSTGGMPAACDGVFANTWINGTACGTDPLIQVHAYDDNTFILRQSLCTSFEGPFLYMMFGQDRVLLEDTGDGGIPVAQVVYDVIDQWLAAQGRDSIELVVVNSHAHGDHVQGNSLFEGQPNTTVVNPNVGALSDFFGINTWPDDIVSFDLGERVIDVIPIPGHQTAHIALFDPNTGFLLTGDTLYPGRLYISDFPTYVQSIQRMVDHVADDTVCHVMGTHIEMTTTPGEDYPFGATVHENEHPLQLGLEHLLELNSAVQAMDGQPQLEVHDDFIIYPL